MPPGWKAVQQLLTKPYTSKEYPGPGSKEQGASGRTRNYNSSYPPSTIRQRPRSGEKKKRIRPLLSLWPCVHTPHPHTSVATHTIIHLTGRKSSRWCWMKKKLRLSYNPLPRPLTTPKPPPPATPSWTGLGRAEIENKNFSHFYIFLLPCVRFPTFPLSHVINFICSVRRRPTTPCNNIPRNSATHTLTWTQIQLYDMWRACSCVSQVWV